MKTPPVIIPINEENVLFDDRSLLETALGKEALKVSSINANCDCSAYYSTENDELVNSHQITASAPAVY